MTEGENFVSLKGKIGAGELKTVGDNETKLFKGKIKIPMRGVDNYVKISAWGGTAEALSETPKNKFVHIQGRIEERSYDGECRHCHGPEKKYWTEVAVENFAVITE